MTDGMLDEGLWTESVLELDHDRWHIGRRLAAKFREQTDAFTQDTTDEFHEVYEAVHIDPSDIPGIMKAKKQIAPWSDGDPFANDTVPGGYIAYIVMERVPGKDLRDFDQLDHHEKNRVRLAFVEALWKLHSHHFTHWDPRPNNIMWDSAAGKCFIVDLEDALRHTNRKDSDVCLDPWEQLEGWGLIEEQHKGLTAFFQKEELLDYLKAELGI